MGIRHNVTFTVYDKDGNVKRVVKSKNTTCVAGRTDIMARLGDFNTSGTSHKGVIRVMAIGDDNTAPTQNDTALGNEIMRSFLTASQTIFDGVTLKVYGRFGQGTALTIEEAGLFTGDDADLTAGSGELLAHTLPDTPLAKASDDVIVLEWELSLANA